MFRRFILFFSLLIMLPSYLFGTSSASASASANASEVSLKFVIKPTIDARVLVKSKELTERDLGYGYYDKNPNYRNGICRSLPDANNEMGVQFEEYGEIELIPLYLVIYRYYINSERICRFQDMKSYDVSLCNEETPTPKYFQWGYSGHRDEGGIRLFYYSKRDLLRQKEMKEEEEKRNEELAASRRRHYEEMEKIEAEESQREQALEELIRGEVRPPVTLPRCVNIYIETKLELKAFEEEAERIKKKIPTYICRENEIKELKKSIQIKEALASAYPNINTEAFRNELLEQRKEYDRKWGEFQTDFWDTHSNFEGKLESLNQKLSYFKTLLKELEVAESVSSNMLKKLSKIVYYKESYDRASDSFENRASAALSSGETLPKRPSESLGRYKAYRKLVLEFSEAYSNYFPHEE